MSQPKTSFTDTELNAEFPNGILPQSVSSSDRLSNGIMSDSAVAAHISTLKKSGVIPIPVKEVDVYNIKVKQLLQNAKKEYSFYNDRYKYTLNQLFNNIRSGYSLQSVDSQNAVKKFLTLSTGLNMKLNDCIQLMKGISDDMITSSNAMQKELETLNTKMKEDKARLDYQSGIIKSNDAAAKIHKEMVRFTEEKTRYNDNLLKLYSFLNVIALGLLFYIYRAAE